MPTRIVSAITSGNPLGLNTPPAMTWTLARHARFGALDLSFGGTGVDTHTAAGPNTTLLDVESLPDGRLLVAGTKSNPPGAVRNTCSA